MSYAASRISRRGFLAGGGSLVVGFALFPRAFAQAPPAGPGAEKAPKLPGSLEKEPMLDSWIRINANGIVTVFTGKVELGQGIKTAFIQIAAEELAVEPPRIELVTADTGRTPDEAYTAGSQSMSEGGTAILNAAAQARAILIGLAAARLNVPAAELTVQNGTVRAAGGRSAHYGELVAGQELHVRAEPTSALGDPGARRVMGKPMQRVDIPAKLSGGAIYVHDLRLVDMVHARVVRPPGYGARLRVLNAAEVEKMPGVLKVVRDGNYLAVVAQREFQAIAAMRALARAAAWNEQATLPAPAELYSSLQNLPSQRRVIVDGSGVGTGVGTIEAAYRRPYQLHGSIGPSCAVGLYKDESLTVWTHSQGVYPLRRAIAEMLRFPEERVRCIHMEGSGCYGHNAADDAGADAALVAVAFPGRPVRIQLMREQEHAWEPYGSAMMSSARARVDPTGRIEAWEYSVWSGSHNTRPGAAGNLLPARLLQSPFEQPVPRPIPQPTGGGDRNAIPYYRFDNTRVVHHFLPAVPLRVSALRSLGAYHNVFSIESFMDEVAAAARADPVDFRLRHVQDTRANDVIRTAAERFGWAGYRKRPGRGRGFAFARYKNLAAYVALACEVTVDHETGGVRLARAVAAVDSGEAVNPDGIRNQIEGGIIQSMSWTLYESVGFNQTRITSMDWSTYPILRMPNLPDTVDVHVISRPGQPFLGTGEAAQGPTAAAIANAVADATGVRLRELPLTARRVKDALGV
ncbi:MAG TPA: molybdopterin cofactor-binding domain-containing protein [Burkholderiales bacterium]|nr:molybdopterin cofactor-binding domain-containing protein [Burkholderiales bacterium]